MIFKYISGLKKNMEVKIDSEFSELIHEDDLTDQEKLELETDIRKRGCVMPLVLWNGILVDGHHRYEICKKYNIPFEKDRFITGV